MPGSFLLLRNLNILETGRILFSLTMMENSRTPEDTETLLKITMDTYTKGENENAGLADVRRWIPTWVCP